MKTQGRTRHTMNFSSSLDCSTPLCVLSKVFLLLVFPVLSFLSTLCCSQEPSSLCTCQTKAYLEKHAQLLCFPAKGFTQPVTQVTRTRKQGCLPLCCPATTLFPVHNKRTLHRIFQFYVNCKQANTADTFYHTAHQSMHAVLDRTLIDHHRVATAWDYWETFQYACLHSFS